jgi:translation initiation factor 3 subunit C
MNEAVAKQKVTPKKMNALAAKGLNAVKQKIKKINKDHQTQVDAYRKNNDAFMESDEEEETVSKPKKTTRVTIEDIAQPVVDDDEGFATVGKGGRALQFTPESIFKHLRIIMESRGKKNTDRQEQIKVMEKLNEIANTPYQKIRVLLTIVSTRFDLGSGGASSMPLEHWKAAEKELTSLFDELDKNPEYVVVENAEEWDDDEKPPALEAGQKYIKVPGSMVSYVERLDDELTRSLQTIDPHTSEYIERLTDEGALYNTILRGLVYYERLHKDEDLAIPQESINRIITRRLDHVYFKVSLITHPLPGSHLLTRRSLRKSSRSSRTTHGRPLPPRPSPSSHLALSRRMLPPSSTLCATTCSATLRASCGPAPCFARCTSWRCTTTTTRQGT